MFAQPAAMIRPVLANGGLGVVVMVDGQPFSVMGFTIIAGKVVAIDVLADPQRLGQVDFSNLD